MVRATPYLIVGWTGLGVFLWTDAWSSGIQLEWLIGGAAFMMAIGNGAIWRRRATRAARAARATQTTQTTRRGT